MAEAEKLLHEMLTATLNAEQPNQPLKVTYHLTAEMVPDIHIQNCPREFWSTMRGKKLHRFIFAIALQKLHLLRQFSTHIYFNKFPITPVFHILYIIRRGTSLSFKSTVGQYTVHTQPSSSFVTRRQSSITAPNLWLPNNPDFSM